MPKNPTPAQIAAARANGARSRGPVSAAGKAKSAQNATTHGLTARAICLPTENSDQFNLLLQAFIEEFRPQGVAELLCVEEMAVAKWKIRRIWALETAALAHSLDRHHADTPADAGHHLRLDIAWSGVQAQINNYAQHTARLQHEYRRNLAQLERLQAIRAAAATEEEAAAAPAPQPQQATPENEPERPAANEPEPTRIIPQHPRNEPDQEPKAA